MRVDEKLPLGMYHKDERFVGRLDATQAPYDPPVKGHFALISRHFFYFGDNAIEISEVPSQHLSHNLEKKGPGFRSDFDEEFIRDFTTWLEDHFHTGVHGEPCDPDPDIKLPKCAYKVRRK